MPNWNGARVLLLGLGRTHNALADHLVRQGADVTLADDGDGPAQRAAAAIVGAIPARTVLGDTGDQLLDQADQLFVSPGISRTHHLVRAALDRGVPVSSEIELVFKECPVPITGITGSAGKTTTTTIVRDILEQAGLPALVGGNIGHPVITDLASVTPNTRVVLELSSFQLENVVTSVHIGAILNVVPNHLDRHPTFDAYRAAKGRLIQFQGEDDLAILNLDDQASDAFCAMGSGRREWFSTASRLGSGAWLEGDQMRIATDAVEGSLCRATDLRVPGMHNVQNAMAAALVAASLGASLEAIRAGVTAFTGIEHRIEFVRDIDGVRWFNDSKATAPAETSAALAAFAGPLVILAGGRSKRVSLDALAGHLAARGRVIVLFGEMRHEISEALKNCPKPVHCVDSLREAITLAHSVSVPGDTVLMSPSGSSFDEFQNYEERGRAFKDMVKALTGAESPA